MVDYAFETPRVQLSEVARALLRPFYELFDMFSPAPEFYENLGRDLLAQQ